jgi:hypothetical protein
MAKRKKAPRRSNGQNMGWHKKIVLGFLVSGVLIGAYCYFTAQSEHIPVIGSMHYPKRTPGSLRHHSTYCVYDRLAESGASKTHKQTPVSRLLPPNEVPEFPEEALSPTTNPEVIPGSTQTGGLVSQHAPSSVEKPLPSKQEPKDIAKQPSENSPVIPKTTKNDPGVTPKAKKQADQKIIGLQAKKKLTNSEKNKANPAPGGAKKKVLSIQIGSVYTKEHQAKALAERLVKRGGVRHGIRPILQKAKVKGAFMYRVVLSGKCSKEDWAAYRAWLMGQDI